MDNDKLIALVQAVSESNLTSFSMKDGNFKITMDKLDHKNITVEAMANGSQQNSTWASASVPVQSIQAQIAPVQSAQSQIIPVLQQELTASAPEVVSNSVVSDVTDASVKEVKSPIVGTFYSAPGEGKEDFVKVGDRVKAGQTLCVVEAMKLMNDIESDFDGEIVEILVKNEEMVEFNQPLFRIKAV